MVRCAFTPYEGKKPYIFVSYAHKDSDRVFPILEELDRRGYRVWYDDGIAPGSEWPENIAQHLDGCSLTLAFISPSSIASANCRREVTFALSKRKPFLGILLEPTEMSLGMEMQLSAQQCIMKYTYQDDGAFYTKVCSCPDLQPCLGQPKPIPQPAPVVPTPAPAPVPQPAPAPKPAPKPSPIPREKKPVDKKLLAIIGGAAAAVVVLAIVLVIALSGGKKGPNADHSTPPKDTHTSSTAPTVAQDPTQLEYAEQNITAEDIAYISQQTKLESLKFYDCVFEEGVLQGLTLPGTLTELILDHCKDVEQLQCLASLQNLEVLELSGSGITNDTLPELSIPALKQLNISGNPDFSALSLFAGCTGLERIDFSNTIVDYVDELAAMEQLTHVDGSHTEVADITPLADLSNLLELRFANCCIATIDKPFHSLYLHTLDLSYNALVDLNAFDYCTVLESVYLSFNQLESTYTISKSAATLTVLDLSGNTYLTRNNLYFLEDSVNMRELYLDGITLFNFEILQNMTMLQQLSAVDCSLTTLDGLESTVGQLRYLNLCFNYFDDIHILSALEGNDIYLDLSFNDYLKDLSLLPSDVTFRVLNLVNSELDYTTIGSVQADALLLLYQYDLEKETWLQTDPCSSYVVVGCPMDRVVAMETLLGRNEITFLADAMEYMEYIATIDEYSQYLEYALTLTA